MFYKFPPWGARRIVSGGRGGLGDGNNMVLMCSGPLIAAEAYYFLLDEKVTKNQAGKIAQPHRPLGLGPGFPAGPLRFFDVLVHLFC